MATTDAALTAVIERSKEAQERIRNRLDGLNLTYHLESYGCQMNDHDSEILAAMLENCGYKKSACKTGMDIVLFNTCCVREHSEKRVFGNVGALKKIKDENPGLIIAVCGCMMQQEGMAEKLYKRFPFVDIIFGTNAMHMFPQMLEEALDKRRAVYVEPCGETIIEGLEAARSSGIFANVTIMYGCDNFCSYCIVPYVRGRERSRAPESIISEIKSLADKGYKEITLVGQNVNSYSYTGTDFPELLRMANGIEGFHRIRFMTSHPKDLSARLIEAMAELDKVCPHMHLPVQSGSDRILGLMNRRYTRGHYLNLIHLLREAMPDVELTTDIIVGFPGETEEDFEDTLRLVSEAGFSAAYTFKYSKRTGTKAATMEEQVPQELKEDRLKRLNARIAEFIKANNRKYIGKTGEVLVEGCDHKGERLAFGKLPNFKMVYLPGDETLIGKLL